MPNTIIRRAARAALLASSALVLCLAACGSDDDGPIGPAADTAIDAGEDASNSDTTDDAPTADADDTGDAVEDVDVDAEPDVPDTPQPEFESFLRMVHLSPDTPPITLYLDGTPVFSDLELFAVAPEAADGAPYRAVETRNYQAVIAPADGTIDDAILTETWNLSPNGVYTIWLGGLSGIERTPPEDAEELTVFVAVDDNAEPVDGAGNPLQRVRFFHAVIGSGPLDFSIGDETVDEDLQFGWFSFDEHLLPLGQFTFGFGLPDSEPLLEVDMGFGNYTTNVWAGGLFDEEEYWFVTLGPDNEIDFRQEVIPQFFDARFVHAAPAVQDAQPDGLDVYRGASQVADALQYAADAPYETIESGRHVFAAFADGADPDADTPLVEMPARTYADGSSHSIVFYDGDSGPAAVRVDHDLTGSGIATNGRFFVHAAEGVDAVTVVPTSGGDAIVTDLAPGSVSDPVNIAGGVHAITITAGDDAFDYSIDLDGERTTDIVIVADGGTPRLLIVEADGTITPVSPLR